MTPRLQLLQPHTWRRLAHQCVRYNSSAPPPPPPQYKPAPPRPEQAPQEPDLPPVRRGLFSRLFGRKETTIREDAVFEPPDPARGIEASERVVREGILDPRYKEAAKLYTRIVVAMPVVIYLGYVLYRRRFEGVEVKEVPAVRKGKDDVEEEVG